MRSQKNRNESTVPATDLLCNLAYFSLQMFLSGGPDP